MDFFDSYMPHGHCYYWTPKILLPTVQADLGIMLAYVVGFTWAFMPWLRQLPTRVALLLAGFILFCGLGHAWDVFNTWHGAYGIEALWNTTTEVISWAFVFVVRRASSQYRLEQREAVHNESAASG